MNRQEKLIVIERVLILPDDMRFMYDGRGWSPKEMIVEIEDGSKTGEYIVEIFMDNLRNWKKIVEEES